MFALKAGFFDIRTCGTVATQSLHLPTQPSSFFPLQSKNAFAQKPDVKFAGRPSNTTGPGVRSLKFPHHSKSDKKDSAWNQGKSKLSLVSRYKRRTNKFSKVKAGWRTYSHWLHGFGGQRSMNWKLKYCYFAFEVTLYYGPRVVPETIMAGTFLAINRQLLELESCSKRLRIREVF